MSTTTPLSDAEKSACICLSTLFLDSEMTSTKVGDMARSLHRLRMPVERLDDLLRNDVFPVLYTNLINPAGVWDGFDETDLVNRVTSRRTHQPNVLQRLGSKAAWVVLAGSITSSWVQVKEKMYQIDQRVPPKHSSLCYDDASRDFGKLAVVEF
ncbi:hypothetical protein Hte_004383 [Hypoxylon texense]